MTLAEAYAVLRRLEKIHRLHVLSSEQRKALAEVLALVEDILAEG